MSSVRLYVARLFAEHLEVLFSVMPCELVPDPPLEEVAAHARLVHDPQDVPVALAAIQARGEYRKQNHGRMVTLHPFHQTGRLSARGHGLDERGTDSH